MNGGGELKIEFRGLMYIGRRKIARQGPRYVIYLPEELRDLWEKLNRSDRKVKVYIEIE